MRSGLTHFALCGTRGSFWSRYVCFIPSSLHSSLTITEKGFPAAASTTADSKVHPCVVYRNSVPDEKEQRRGYPHNGTSGNQRFLLFWLRLLLENNLQKQRTVQTWFTAQRVIFEQIERSSYARVVSLDMVFCQLELVSGLRGFGGFLVFVHCLFTCGSCFLLILQKKKAELWISSPMIDNRLRMTGTSHRAAVHSHSMRDGFKENLSGHHGWQLPMFGCLSPTTPPSCNQEWLLLTASAKHRLALLTHICENQRVTSTCLVAEGTVKCFFFSVWQLFLVLVTQFSDACMAGN